MMMEDIVLDDGSQIDAGALSEIFSTLNPSIIQKPEAERIVIVSSGLRPAEPTSPFSSEGEEEEETKEEEEEQEEDAPPSIDDEESPDLENRMKLQKEISRIESDIQNLCLVKQRLENSDAFDSQDIEQVDSRCEALKALIEDKKKQLSMHGEKMQCCREMDQKIKTRLEVLRECEGIVNFRNHRLLAEFFAKKHLRLRDMLVKMSSI